MILQSERVNDRQTDTSRVEFLPSAFDAQGSLTWGQTPQRLTMRMTTDILVTRMKKSESRGRKTCQSLWEAPPRMWTAACISRDLGAVLWSSLRTAECLHTRCFRELICPSSWCKPHSCLPQKALHTPNFAISFYLSCCFCFVIWKGSNLKPGWHHGQTVQHLLPSSFSSPRQLFFSTSFGVKLTEVHFPKHNVTIIIKKISITQRTQLPFLSGLTHSSISLPQRLGH